MAEVEKRRDSCLHRQGRQEADDRDERQEQDAPEGGLPRDVVETEVGELVRRERPRAGAGGLGEGIHALHGRVPRADAAGKHRDRQAGQRQDQAQAPPAERPTGRGQHFERSRGGEQDQGHGQDKHEAKEEQEVAADRPQLAGRTPGPSKVQPRGEQDERENELGVDEAQRRADRAQRPLKPGNHWPSPFYTRPRSRRTAGRCRRPVGSPVRRPSSRCRKWSPR